jgi:hypothetical protein
MQAKIIERLAAGSTIKTTCDSVGIGETTYYQWIAVGNAHLDGLPHEKMPRAIVDRDALAKFAEEATRAIANGMITAAIRFKEGMNPSESESVTTETSVETRLRKVKKDGAIIEEPYEYRKTVTRKTVTHNPGDWRAAMEYLARRDPENWARTAPQRTEIANAPGETLRHTVTWEDMIKRDNAD